MKTLRDQASCIINGCPTCECDETAITASCTVN